MMSSLFSMFDPSMSFIFSSWLLMAFFVLFLPSVFWVLSVYSELFSLFSSFLKKEVDCVLYFPMKGTYLFISSIFVFVFFCNFLALFPFIFSVTSHMLVTFPFSFSFWVGIIFFCWFSSMKHFLAHLIPVGTPVFLISFMVLVELLSNFIRPIALTFRLTANMMAGHLLLSIVGGFLVILPFSGMLFGSAVQFLLSVMELGVSLVQAYVYSALLLLYVSDSEH